PCSSSGFAPSDRSVTHAQVEELFGGADPGCGAAPGDQMSDGARGDVRAMVEVAVEEERLAADGQHVSERGHARHRGSPGAHPPTPVERIDAWHVALADFDRHGSPRNDTRPL